GCHIAAVKLLHPIAIVVKHILARSADDLFKDMVLLSKIEELRCLIVSASAGTAAARIMNLDRDHAMRIRIRKRIQKYVLDCAEDGSGGADPERQGDDRQEREPRFLTDSAQPKTKVLEYPMHRRNSRFLFWR